MQNQARPQAKSKAVQIVKSGPTTDESSLGSTLAVVGLVMVTLSLAAALGWWLRHRRVRPHGEQAFGDLAALLRLSRQEQETVRKMAKASGITEPVALLVSHEAMREAAQAYLRLAAQGDAQTQAATVLAKVHGY